MTKDSPLSERELEILRLVATGASNKEIAAELYISVNTVKVHLRNIYSKLDVSSRTEATIYAVREGLVPSPRPEPEPAAVPANEAVPVPEPRPSNAGWKRWGKWLAAAGILLLLLLTAGLLGAQWVKRQAPAAAPADADLQTLEQNRWQERAPMQMARAGFAASVFDNRIYAAGGETPSGITATAERYDVAEDAWAFIAEMPEPLADIQGATVGGRIYVPGGRRPDDSLSAGLLVYDPRTDTWETRASMPVPLSAYALVAFEGKLYLFGGWDGEQYTDTVLRYDPSLDAWTVMTPMPTARGYAGAAVSGGKIYVMGGYDGEQGLDVNEVYAPARGGEDGNPWEQGTPLPEIRYKFGITSIADFVHLAGGESGVTLGLHLEYVSREDQWSVFDDFFATQSWTSLRLKSLDEYLYAFGGMSNGDVLTWNKSYQAIYTITLPVVR